jgi:hypothetical protein
MAMCPENSNDGEIAAFIRGETHWLDFMGN